MIAHAYQFTPNEDLTEPYVALACAIMEQAVLDIHILRRNGILVDGEVVKKWPHKLVKSRCKKLQAYKYGNHYNHPRAVEELIEFIRGPYLEQLIEWAGIKNVCKDDFIAHLEGRTPIMDGNTWKNQRASM